MIIVFFQFDLQAKNLFWKNLTLRETVRLKPFWFERVNNEKSILRSAEELRNILAKITIISPYVKSIMFLMKTKW